MWETSSDNIGLRAAYASSFLILVQADVLVTEVGWNRRLVAPLLLFGDLFAVSARAAHNIADGRGSHLARSFSHCFSFLLFFLSFLFTPAGISVRSIFCFLRVVPTVRDLACGAGARLVQPERVCDAGAGADRGVPQGKCNFQ